MEPKEVPLKQLGPEFKSKISKKIQLKSLLIPVNLIKTLTNDFKDLLLEITKHPQILKEMEPNNCKRVLLSQKLSQETQENWPEKFRNFIISHNIKIEDYELIKSYESHNYHEALEQLLPKDVVIPTSFEIVGSIAHLNLRETQLPFKEIIAQVLLDKNPAIKTVVNKTEALSNVYRTPELEILAGVPNLETEVKEGKCIFKLAYDKVYWNSKLQAERDRMLDLFKENDVMLDLFCGVGPLSVRAAKKGCFVVANDLNPNCYEYLKLNVTKNHVESKVSCFNMDARECFKKAVSSVSNEVNEKIPLKYRIFNHVYMNLPGDAITFLDIFFGFLKLCDKNSWEDKEMPLIHVYSFSEADEIKSKEVLSKRIEKLLPNFQKSDILHFHTIKDVSSLKKMYGITFRLRKDDAEGTFSKDLTDKNEEETKFEDYGDVAIKKIKKN